MTIDQFCARLRAAGIQGVDSYQQRLRDNERDRERFQDFACEGYVALAFSKRGWAMTMRDSPDLEGRLNGIYLGIEVKHFRYKHAHDPIEDAALRSGGETLARIPFLSETEGREDAWDQMFRFAMKNAHQYADGEFNVIFFWCSTQAHFDGTLMTAVNIYDEAIQIVRSSHEKPHRHDDEWRLGKSRLRRAFNLLETNLAREKIDHA
jgi:hypothetical protein